MLKSYRRRSHKRRGVECIEVAVTLPVFITVMIATISICHTWHMEKLLRVASYEAIKAACRPEGTVEDAKRVFATQAESLGIAGSHLEVETSENFAPGMTGESIEVCGKARITSNWILAPVQLYFGDELRGGWIMHRKVGQ